MPLGRRLYGVVKNRNGKLDDNYLLKFVESDNGRHGKYVTGMSNDEVPTNSLKLVIG